MINNSIRIAVRSTYDIQKQRISTGNRIAAIFKEYLGIEPGEKFENADEDAKKVLKQVKDDYDLVCEGYAEKLNKRNFKPTKLITTWAEFELISSYFDLLQTEKLFFKALEASIESVPIYTEYLKDIYGVGPAMAGVLISEIDIEKTTYVSSLWKYAGLDVAEDGRGRGRYKEHLIDREYVNKKGEVKTKKSITFNAFLKTKLYVLGTSFLKQNPEKCKYRVIYDNYKHRLQNRPDCKDYTKAHIHNMAIRYAIKIFLQDLWVVWRKMEGLPTPDPYREAKLGMPPHHF